jgi:hypothetical protein
MSWQIGLMLACGWLVAIYLILAFFDVAKRGDRDWNDDYQWKLRRKIEREGKRQQWGGR